MSQILTKDMKKKFTPYFSLILILGCPFIWMSCASPKQASKENKYSETKIMMGQTIQIDVCTNAAIEPHLGPAYEKVWQWMNKVDSLMSSYKDDSEVASINKSYKNPVKVSRDIYILIREALRMSRVTYGAFDITVGPLMDLWKRSEKEQKIPDKASIENALTHMGSDMILVTPPDLVELKNPKARIDLGGIAIGYAVDEAARILAEHKIYNFLIDAGGDVYASGTNCQGTLWRIGVRDPRHREKIMDVIQTSNAAVATSGDYEKFYQVNGKKWSHIMDPKTGYPQEKVTSATVIAPTATIADALSTALTILEPEVSINLLNSMGHHYAGLIVVKKEGGEIEKIPSRRYPEMLSSNTNKGM